MTVTTLGTSHGFNTPGNFYTSTLIETKTASYLVDAGCQAETLMIHAGKNVGNIRAIFITHAHHDHIAGILGVLKDIIRVSDYTQHIKVFLPEDISKPMMAWAEAIHMKLCDITFIHVKEGEIYDDGECKVEAIQTKHLKSGDEYVSYAYAIEVDGKKILCSGDLSREFTDFPKITQEKEFDLCVCEATHYIPECAAAAFEKAKIKRIIFNHIGNRWRGEENGKVFLSYMKNVKSKMEFAVDGQTYTV